VTPRLYKNEYGPPRPNLKRIPLPQPLKHKRYPWEKPKEMRKMSIAVGVVCLDGIVVGVDLQYSTDFVKTAGRKIFVLKRSYETDTQCSIVIAAAGSPDSAKKIVERIEEVLPKQIEFSDLVDSIETALADVFGKHIDSAPESERNGLHVDLLVAARIGPHCKLYRSNRTMLIEEEHYACIGMGLYLGHYVIGMALPMLTSVNLASQVVAYTIAAAKDYIESVGKGSDIHILKSVGVHDSILKPERQEIELGFEEFFRCLRGVISTIDPDSASEETVKMHLTYLGAAVSRLRSAHNVRAHNRELRQARAEAVRLNRQSTTADPSPLPPLPESPGGTDES
jgi:hypothetical protein